MSLVTIMLQLIRFIPQDSIINTEGIELCEMSRMMRQTLLYRVRTSSLNLIKNVVCSSILWTIVLILATGCTNALGKPADQGHITIENAWAASRTPENVGIFMTIRTTDPQGDRLISAHSEMAANVRILTHMTVNGATRMQPITLAIEPNRPVSLNPGENIIRLEGLRHELQLGQTVEVMLVFERSGTIKVTAPVRNLPTN
jgi:periplasmic copper chaperone A